MCQCCWSFSLITSIFGSAILRWKFPARYGKHNLNQNSLSFWLVSINFNVRYPYHSSETVWCFWITLQQVRWKIWFFFKFPISNEKFSEENFATVGRVKETYGDIAGVWMLSDFHVLLADASAVEVSSKKITAEHTHLLQ